MTRKGITKGNHHASLQNDPSKRAKLSFWILTDLVGPYLTVNNLYISNAIEIGKRLFFYLTEG